MCHPLFRQAVSADIPAMSQIRLAVTENVLRDPARITVDMYEDYLERSGRGWVAESAGEIVAFCYADKVNASIWALFVRPDHEGQGLGKALLARAVDWLFDVGHECVHLTTGAGTRADRFYAAQGWLRRPVGAADIGYSLARPAARDDAPIVTRPRR
jgi:GNAT superfamily N-acetyltransferase